MKTVSKTEAFVLIRDLVFTSGLVKNVHYTENCNPTKPSEKELVDVVPELHRELNCLGPQNAYCRAHIPLKFVVSETEVTREHWSQGFNYGTFTLVEREFFEGHIGVDLHQDAKDPSRGFLVTYAVDSDLRGWKTLKEIEEYPSLMERFVPVFRQVDELLSTLNVVESPEDFAWVQEQVKAKAKPRKIDDLDEFASLCMDVVNDEAHWDDPSIVKGLCKFLKKRGAKKGQLKDFDYLLTRLADDKSELSGSPDANVVERFKEHNDALFKILNNVLGKDQVEELDLFF